MQMIEQALSPEMLALARKMFEREPTSAERAAELDAALVRKREAHEEAEGRNRAEKRRNAALARVGA